MVCRADFWLCVQRTFKEQCSEDHVRCQGSNPGRLRARQALYPLYYHLANNENLKFQIFIKVLKTKTKAKLSGENQKQKGT